MKKVVDLPEGLYASVVVLCRGDFRGVDVFDGKVVKKPQQKYLLKPAGDGYRSFGQGTGILEFSTSSSI